MWGSHCRASEPRLGARVECGELGQAVAGAPCLESAGALWRSLDSPAPQQPGARVRSYSESPAVFERLGHGGGPGSRGGTGASGTKCRGWTEAKAMAASLERGLVRTGNSLWAGGGDAVI